jgi:hypothetical protein
MKKLVLGLYVLGNFSAFAGENYDRMMNCFKDGLQVEHAELSFITDFFIGKNDLKNCKVMTSQEMAKEVVDYSQLALENVDGGLDSDSICNFDASIAQNELASMARSYQVIKCESDDILARRNYNSYLDHGATIVYKSLDSDFQFATELMVE